MRAREFCGVVQRPENKVISLRQDLKVCCHGRLLPYPRHVEKMARRGVRTCWPTRPAGPGYYLADRDYTTDTGYRSGLFKAGRRKGRRSIRHSVILRSRGPWTEEFTPGSLLAPQHRVLAADAQHHTKTCVRVAIRGRVVVAVGRTTMPRIVVPATTTKKAAKRPDTLPLPFRNPNFNIKLAPLRGFFKCKGIKIFA